jgi:transcriptional regulator with XRE-family HTH domain
VSLAIRALRSSLGETQAQFAPRVGVALATLVRYESGAQRPRPAMLTSFADIAEQHRLSELAVAFREGFENRTEEARRTRTLDVEQLAVQIRDLRGLEELLEHRRKAESVTRSASDEEYTHQILWRCTQTQLRLARTCKQEGSDFLLTALLLADLALEAYLNYVGEILAPKASSFQDQESNKKTTLMKLRSLVKVVHAKYPDENKQPFSSVIELNSLRNEIVHPQVRYDRADQLRKGRHRRPLRDELNQIKAERMLSDLYAFIEQLHTLFREKARPKLLTEYALDTRQVVQAKHDTLR